MFFFKYFIFIDIHNVSNSFVFDYTLVVLHIHCSNPIFKSYKDIATCNFLIKITYYIPHNKYK